MKLKWSVVYFSLGNSENIVTFCCFVHVQPYLTSGPAKGQKFIKGRTKAIRIRIRIAASWPTKISCPIDKGFGYSQSPPVQSLVQSPRGLSSFSLSCSFV